MRKYFNVGLILFVSSLGFADDLKLDEVPPLTPIRLLVSKLDPTSHLLLAREASGGNYYLLINDGTGIRVPKQKQRSKIYYDGGSADLYLESGERVLLPTKQQKENYLNTSLGPTIIYSDKAPMPLKDVGVSDQKLQRLGFARFIAPPENKQQSSRRDEWTNYSPLQNLDTKIIVQIQFKDHLEYDRQSQIEKNLKNLDISRVKFLELGNQILFGQASITLLADPSALDLIRQHVDADAVVSISTFNPKQITTGERKLPTAELGQFIANLSDKRSPLQTRIESLHLVHQNADQLASLADNYKIRLMKGILNTLGDIDQVHSQIHKFSMYETAVQDFKAGRRVREYRVSSLNNIRRSEAHAARALFLEPLRRIGRQGFEVLDRMQHPIARQMVVETSSAIYGAGLPLLQGQPTGISHSYFREWLDQQQESLALIDKLPQQADFAALEALELRMSTPSGVIFENMGVSGNMSGLSSVARRPIYFTDQDTTERLPTILLGLPGNKDALKRELIQYIIMADKKAQKLAAWSKEASKGRDEAYSRNRSFEVEGDDNLFKLIVGLTHIPSIAKYAVPNFSEVEYQRNIIEVFQQLLEIANTSIVNMGTYVSLLEASLVAIKEVERQHGLNNHNQARLTRRAVQLQRIVHHKMIRGLSWISHEAANANACAILLSPDPWQTLRANR